MAITVADIRRRKQAERLSALQQQANVVLGEQPGGSLWLFGSWARGDWDGFSDVDVLALTEQEWQERRNGNDPYWRAIGRDAVRLSAP
jgi:UTP:GlnB (protein PII) uridylyltransferase